MAEVKVRSVIIYAGGLCLPHNPGGHACYGWVALDRDSKDVVATGKGYLGCGRGLTTDMAEYSALISALRWARDWGFRGVVLKMESRLVVKLASGRGDSKSDHPSDLLAQVREEVRWIGARVEWVAENERAEALSKEAYLAALRNGAGQWFRLESTLPRPRPRAPCYACGGRDWWQYGGDPKGEWKCGRCHPNPLAG
jgi:ribonuclease HI